MSFITSLGLSANNLRTKKGRTIMTAFAGSIGIIGIALILALSSGVNAYIQGLEEDTMAEYPIQITNSSMDITSLLSSMSPPGTSFTDSEDSADTEEISVTKVITGMFSQMSSNDLTSLKEYIDSGESGMQDYVKAIEYTYDVTPLIYMADGEEYRQVNPDTSISTSSGSILSLMSGSTSSFYVMPSNETLYEDQYEVKAGHWPENYNECVLVLTSSGSVSDYMLYTLGLRDYSELEEMIDQYNNGEDVKSPDNIGSYSYEDVLGTTYKVVNTADLYAYDEDYGVWVDKSDNESFVQDLVAQSEDLTIVGVVQPKEDTVAANLTSGINYPMSLIYHMSGLAAESDVVKAQMADSDINIFTGEKFGEEADGLDLNSLLSVDEDALSDVFSFSDAFSDIDLDLSDMEIDMSDFDLSDMDLDMDSLDLSGMDLDLSDMEIDMSDFDLSSMLDLSDMEIEVPGMDMNGLMSSITIDSTQLNLLAQQILSGYSAVGFTDYLTGDDAKGIMVNAIKNLNSFEVTVDENGLKEAISSVIGDTNEGTVSGGDSGDSGNDDSSHMVDNVYEAVSSYVSENASVTISDADAAALADTLADELAAGYTDSLENDFSAYLSSESVTGQLSSGLQLILVQQMGDVMNSYMEVYTSAIMETMQAQMSTAMQQMMGEMMSWMTEQISAQISEQVSAAMENMMSEMMDKITEQISVYMEDAMSGMMDDLLSQMSDALTESFTIDADSLSDAFAVDMDSADLTDLLTSMSLGTGSSYNSNLNSLGYIDLMNPSEIDIYPTDFDSKSYVVDILDDYNDRMEAAGESEKMISYTDMVSTMMSSVTTITNVVSYVLIAFIAVSLIVSCIMISIITQISVMERTKEIGILRAMGASKANISQVFNAETFIIGTCSGLIGVIATRLLIIPINVIIHVLTGNASVNAVLPLSYAVILVVISIVITVLSGFIPALKAARQDPVTALRTE